MLSASRLLFPVFLISTLAVNGVAAHKVGDNIIAKPGAQTATAHY